MARSSIGLGRDVLNVERPVRFRYGLPFLVANTPWSYSSAVERLLDKQRAGSSNLSGTTKFQINVYNVN